jgi:hypothetical protein
MDDHIFSGKLSVCERAASWRAWSNIASACVQPARGRRRNLVKSQRQTAARIAELARRLGIGG